MQTKRKEIIAGGKDFNILCFYLWAVGNIAWLGFDVASGLYSRAVLDIVHLAFAIWGIFAWGKDESRPSE